MQFFSLYTLVALLYIQSEAVHASTFSCNKPNAKGFCMIKINRHNVNTVPGWKGHDWASCIANISLGRYSCDMTIGAAAIQASFCCDDLEVEPGYVTPLTKRFVKNHCSTQ
ncbi:hypothetical protein PtA15_9A679 [Puccinia triticina]|uniref:Cyanovirin-N domain-containing protein n=1 Tax=Puccinia triticina TaxID=208348 RepID=A0ABY7CVS6_9BASI|nr:uncharacterized protein PtA15_9A679 [Puccinia triticina]WAQ88552.1 hypothetical protein PtA15_9A679 [Puccinia triticina]